MPLRRRAIFSAVGVFRGYLIRWCHRVDSGRVLCRRCRTRWISAMTSSPGTSRAWFGVAVTAIALFEGYDAPPTARAFPVATTRTVCFLVARHPRLDFVLTAFLFKGSRPMEKPCTCGSAYSLLRIVALFVSLPEGGNASATFNTGDVTAHGRVRQYRGLKGARR